MMEVITRSGETESVSFDKISFRLVKLSHGLDERYVKPMKIAQETIAQMHDKITTEELDNLSADISASYGVIHPDFNKFAARICVSNLHKSTDESFLTVMKELYQYRNSTGEHNPLISKELYELTKKYSTEIQNKLDFSRDYDFDFFGIKTLERAYLMRIKKDINNLTNSKDSVKIKLGKIVERPQHMWMRVSLGIHGDNINEAFETYNYLSKMYFTHATPTLYNAGTSCQQLSSCFLQGMGDSIDGIFKTISDSAQISKRAGGIGIHISAIRASGSRIRGTNGRSDGIVPMCKVINETARYVNQGGRRKGSIAVYIEPWHADIFEFCELRKPVGSEEMRARDLFLALWIPDLFMKRVEKDGDWCLMCPDECPNLVSTFGDEFEKNYCNYEETGRYRQKIKARELWRKILESQIETGLPYMAFKDTANKRTNQNNLGLIRSSNLCCVHKDTLLLTDKGHIRIEELQDKKVNIWNGKEYSEVIVRQTNDKAELLTIEFSDGSELICTKYHKFYIQTKYTHYNMKQDIINSSNVELIEADKLREGMKLIKCNYPIINNKKKLKYAYTNGFFSGDGTYSNSGKEEKECMNKSLKGKSFCKRHIDYQKNKDISEYCKGISYKKKPIVSLYGEKIKLLEYLDYKSTGKEKDNKLNVTLPVDLEEKFFVPMDYSLKSKLEWFSGYCDADGCISKNEENQSLQISCIHKDFLIKVKLMLQTCGISSKVTLNMNERLTLLPDGKNGMNYYKTKTLWRLLVGSNDLQKLVELGFTPKRLIINDHKPQRNAGKFVKISKIIDNGHIDKTFCFTEKKRHAGIFNGIITSQCEIFEYSDEKEYAVCNLASIALPSFIEYKKINGLLKIYSKSNCKYCKMAKELLRNQKIEYEEVNLDDDIKRKDFFTSLNDTSINTVPQIFIENERIGRYEQLSDYLRPTYNFKMLLKISKIVTRNLNKVIDVNFYPVPETRLSNLKHRPIGLGVQGLADVYNILRHPFGSKEARDLNKRIFETIYYGCLEASNEIAKERLDGMKKLQEYSKDKLNIPMLYDKNFKFEDLTSNELYHNLKPLKKELVNDRGDLSGSYSTFIGSNFSLGKFQFNLWGLTDKDLLMGFNWNKLRNSVIKYGTRNSLLTALMPTASTSQLLGNNECFEPYTSNLYTRSTLAGDYIVINTHLIKDLIELNLWNKELREEIIYFNGSLKSIIGIPQYIKDIYEIAYDMPQKNIVQQAVERGPFVDQSQSMNLFMERFPNSKKLGSSHFYSWKNGLKTGMYYLRSLPAVDAIKFGLDALSIKNIELKYEKNKFNDTSSVESYDFAEKELDKSKNLNIRRNEKMKVSSGRTYEVCDTCSS
jgi:ribonucleoside-diphosphate reductase alpha chain